jgi:outer membrane immunogenic protein
MQMKQMKKIMLGAVALVALSLSAPASAADLAARPYVKAPPPPEPIYTWTGFYIGANVGWGWARNRYTGATDGTSGGVPFLEQTIQSVTGGTAQRDLNGILGGGQFGFNYEFVPHWVVGLEADADAADLTGSNTHCTFSVGVLRGCSHVDAKIDDFGTLRGRFGYAFDKVLLYGTGGFAWGHSKSTSQPFCNGPACPAVSAFPVVASPLSSSASFVGWAAGAGAEWRFLPNWSVRAEYLHLQFDNVGVDGGGSETIGGTPVVFTYHTSSNIGINVVRVGVNYNFGWGGPVVAKY